MVQIASLFYGLLALSSSFVSAREIQSTPKTGSDQASAKTTEVENPIITKAGRLKDGTSEIPVPYRVVGQLIWRTKTGYFRLQFGNGHKGFLLQGNKDKLQKYRLGDHVEVSGKDLPSSLMTATKVRRVKPWDGHPLHCEPAYQNQARTLWRYVEHTAVIREILVSPDCCRLFMGSKVVAVVSGKLSDEKLMSLLGTRVKVCGSSFKPPPSDKVDVTDFLYLGVLDPDVQIKATKLQPHTLPHPAKWLTLNDATINYVSPRYIAVEGYGLITAMSQHLEVGDVVEVKALSLDHQQLDGRSIWLKTTGRRRPALPTVVDSSENNIRKHLHQLVQVEGTVEHCYVTERGPTLLLSDEQRTYLVNLPFPDELHQVDQYVRGAVVSLTGVVRSTSQSPDETVRLDVADASDLVISETPMMFRAWLVKTIVAVIITVVLILGVRYWALRRQVLRTSAEISTSTSRMVAASSAVRHGLLIFDSASRVRFVSDNVRSTLGTELFTGHSESRTRCRLQSVIRNPDSFIDSWQNTFRSPRTTFEGEFSLLQTDRQVFAFSAPVYDSAGHPDGRIWTFEDITERQKLEEETQQTRKLGAIGRLAGGVAHDFNNLLQVIGSNLELMQLTQGQAQDPQATSETFLEPALAAVQRGAELTRQLLTFAKTSRVEIAQTDVNQRLEQTVRMLDRTLGDHIRLSVSFTPDLPPAEVDSGQLEQVVINMCLNSSDAIGLHDGFIRITTSTAEHEQIGHSIMIQIDDDGCGMSSEVQSHVFEPFFTTKDIDKGTGLGLATAFGAIEQMRGRIECSSTVGEGTSFRIYLPRSNNHPAEIAAVGIYTDGKASRSVSRRVLLVDDDAGILATVKQLLNRLGHDVVCAGGGAEAIRKLETEAVDLVILDLSMPEMTGWQVLQKIREVYPDLKVIVCSGYSDDASEMIACDVEPDAFLNKPFQQEQLSIALELVAKSN